MTKTKTVKKLGSVKEEPKKLKYSFEVSVNGTEYKGHAVTLEKAIADFVVSPAFPFGAKTKAVIKFGNSKDMRIRVYSAMQARRVFNQISLKPTAVKLLAGNFMTQLE